MDQARCRAPESDSQIFRFSECQIVRISDWHIVDRQISKLSDCHTKPLRPLEKPWELLQPFFRIWISLTSLNNAKKRLSLRFPL